MGEGMNNFTFNTKDREIISLMNSLGMNGNTSKVVIYLSRVTEASSSIIEESVDLRQSEVSIVTSWLRGKGWIKSRNIKRSGKGRPTTLFKLRFPLKRIINEFEAEKYEEIYALRKKLNDLKRLAK
jgi:predicted transcriptional regulator